MVLVVLVVLDLARLPAHDRVRIAGLFRAQRNAQQRRLPASLLQIWFAQQVQVFLGQLLGQQGHGRLGCDHQLRRGRAQLPPVPAQGQRNAAAGLELLILRDIALQHGHAQRWPFGRWCIDGGIAKPPQPAPGQNQGRHSGRAPCRPKGLSAPRTGRQGGQPIRQPGRHRPRAVDADPARQHRQGPFDVGIAPRAPGKAGPQPATRQFGQQPDGGEKQGAARRAGGAQLVPAPGGHRVVAAQEGRKRQHGGNGQRRRQSAIDMHGDEQPPEGGHQPGGGIEHGPPRRLGRALCRLQGACQHGQRQNLQPPQRAAIAADQAQRPVALAARPGPGQRQGLGCPRKQQQHAQGEPAHAPAVLRKSGRTGQGHRPGTGEMSVGIERGSLSCAADCRLRDRAPP